MSKLQSFFSKSFWLFVAPFLFLVGAIGTDVFYFLSDVEAGSYYFVGDIFVAAVAVIVCLTYKNHNKNVMKALVGGLLMYLCVLSIDDACYYLFFEDTIEDKIFSVTLAVLAITFFIDHMFLASNHKSNAFFVKLNLIVGLLFIACIFAWEISSIIKYGSSALYGVLWVFLNIGLIILVMNIESKIDYFKQLRDAKEE